MLAFALQERFESCSSQPMDSAAGSATTDTDILDDAPTPGEVRRAIQKLKNGRASGQMAFSQNC